MKMIVLGIDPGTANTGYGVVARRGGRMVALDGGVVQTSPALEPAARLAAIHARVVGQARGVVLLAAGQRGIPCWSYTPQQIKSAVCGSGRAAKDQVQRMVQTLLLLDELPRPDHAADALAVAICHANSAPMRRALAHQTTVAPRRAPRATRAARA